MPEGREQSPGRSQRLVRATFALVFVLPLTLVVGRCAFSPAVPWVVPSEAAPWVTVDAPVSADLEQWGEREVAPTRFIARLAPSRVAPDARLDVRALGDARVLLDGVELARFEREGMRGRARGEVPLALEPGARARLVVEVRNAYGPGLLALTSRGITPPLSSADGLRAGRGDAPPAPAVPADDTRPNPRALAVGTPREAFAKRAPLIAALALLGAGLFVAGRRAFGAHAGRVFGCAAPLVASAVWLGPVAARFAQIPLDVGFDASHHVLYAEELLATRSLPDAAAGWSTYHPPFFYALAALLLGSGGAAVSLKWLTLLAGLASVWLAWWLVRRLAPEAPAAAGLAALFAAVLPMNLTSAAYFSNEGLHAALAGSGLVAVAALLRGRRTGVTALGVAALLLGAAALTKFTVLVVLPVALFFLALKLALVERLPLPRVATLLLGFVGGVALVAGWFYLRTYLAHGTPVMGNWALPGEDQRWWQQPGFHTPAYYLGFGEALVHPYLAGFHSFWDALYSTAWGDGYIAGRTDPWRRHAFWSYDFMSAGYWLALPATLLLVLGVWALARAVLREGSACKRLALGFLLTAGWAVALAFTTLTYELALFAQAKAPYGLMLTAPAALAFAAGYLRLDGWLAHSAPPWTRAALAGWLAAFAVVLLLGFIGPPGPGYAG